MEILYSQQAGLVLSGVLVGLLCPLLYRYTTTRSRQSLQGSMRRAEFGVRTEQACLQEYASRQAAPIIDAKRDSTAEIEKMLTTGAQFSLRGSLEIVRKSILLQPNCTSLTLFILLPQQRQNRYEYVGPTTRSVSDLARECEAFMPEVLDGGLYEGAKEQGLSVFREQDERVAGLASLGLSGLYIRVLEFGGECLGVLFAGIDRPGDVAALQAAFGNEGRAPSSLVLASQVFAWAALRAQAQRNVATETVSELIGLLHDSKASVERVLEITQGIAESDVTHGELPQLHSEMLELAELQHLALHLVTEPTVGQQHAVPLVVADVLVPLVDRLGVVANRNNKVILLTGELHAVVCAPPQVLRRVLSNYLMNAIRYSNSELLRLEVQATETHIKCKVIDEGPGLGGISQGSLSSLRGGTESKDGYGVGLQHCEAIVTASDGYTWFAPSGGAGHTGSIFGVAFPRTSLAVSFEQGLESLRILVLDDDALVCRAHARLLRSYVAEVYTATSISAAEALLQGEKIDCVLADFHIGSVSIAEFKSLFSSEVPVVVCSGGLSVHECTALRHVGQFVYLEKPVARVELLSAIRASCAQTAQSQMIMRRANG